MTALLLLIYNILTICFFCIITPFALLFSSNFRRNFSYKTKERFVLWDFPSPNNTEPSSQIKTKRIWFHCSSIGEVRAAEPLFKMLKSGGGISIVLTVVTKTARKYAENIKDIDFISLFPLDIYPLMSRAFNIIKPDILAPIETEIWPSLLFAAHIKKVKIISVNGRISDKTFKFYKFFSFFWSAFISCIGLVLARSAEDGAHYKVLSKNKSRIIVCGNIKYDRDFNASADRKKFNLKDGDFVFTAGSIREGEEESLISVYKEVSKQYPNLKFFLAPRHLEALQTIKNILSEKGIPYSLFSELSLKENQNFIIVDVFGVLQDIYSISDLCFIGGSLIDKGGQNPIEAAAYSKAVLFGKFMDNFKTEAQNLLEAGGAIAVSDTLDLQKQVLNLLSDRGKLFEMGKKAFEAVKKQKGSLKLAAEALRREM
ncbi:MAG: hypothetical protein LBH29_03940 [Elusimicrobiota bacterium]|jgi:3-deoxy-D-manno-octulosonic-acid transferase|nr:hypothetical protein [Elusimicrobiota bacterium]